METTETMAGKPEKRKTDGDTTPDHNCSNEKCPKLSDTDNGILFKGKDGAAMRSQASDRNGIPNLSDQEHPAKLEGKGKEGCELCPEGSTLVKKIRDGGESVSSSAETVILSEEEYGEEEKNANHGSATVNLGASSHTLPLSASPSPRQLWKGTSLVKDADTIAAIIPDADSALVFDVLAKHRANPDRLNIATVTVLDSSSSLADATEHDRKPAGSSPDHVPDASWRATTDENGGQGTSHDNNSVYDDVKKVVARVRAVKPDAKVNVTQVYMLLEQHKERGDRIGFVCKAFLEEGDPTHQQTEATSANDIFNQAMKLNSEFPHINPSVIYELLEKFSSQENPLDSVREKLQTQPSSAAWRSVSNLTSTPKVPIPNDDSISNDPLARNDPVFRDMRIISKMFPEKDQNEIYALVEAHYYKNDRVQVVIEELLRVEKNSQDSSTLSHSLEFDSGLPTPASTPSKGAIMSGLGDGPLQDDVSHLRDIFPDCDPNYIFECLEACKDTANRVKVVATQMFERRDYPRLREVAEKQTKEARKRRLQNMNFTLEEFLEKFPDPATTFASDEKEMKESYKAHVAAQLKHDFPDFKQSYMNSVIEKHNSHLLPIVREVEAVRADIFARGGTSKKMRQAPKEEPLIYPAEPDEYFFYELWFSRHEQRVKDYFERKEVEHKVKVEEARARNELYECGCCFEDECLFTEMNVCADGHLFCRQCIARSAEAAFGEGKTSFPCLTGFCEHQIPLSVLKEVLPSSMFSKVLRKLQEEEVRQAGIADLVDCPFCSFATIMSDPNDRVFRCLNPECLKDSCRLCREPNHVPLKCDEVEKQNETDMRTFIEKRVTEAMLRKCHRCGKRFVKDVGCNKMTCICGATSCYICREPDIDYSHFNGSRCNEGDMNKLHQEEMERAAEEAKNEYLRDHPEAAVINLKHNPVEHIQYRGGGNVFGDDGGSDDSIGSENENDSTRDTDESFSDEDDEAGRYYF